MITVGDWMVDVACEPLMEMFLRKAYCPSCLAQERYDDIPDCRTHVYDTLKVGIIHVNTAIYGYLYFRIRHCHARCK